MIMNDVVELKAKLDRIIKEYLSLKRICLICFEMIFTEIIKLRLNEQIHPA